MNKKLISEVMRHLGKLGGSTKTKAKAEASRRNGMKGGRPRKTKCSQPAAGSHEYRGLLQQFGDLLEVNP